jgi:hypothetical protein
LRSLSLFIQQSRDKAWDTNGNGLYDTLQVIMSVSVSVPDTYQIDASLVDANGQEIARFSQTQDLKGGALLVWLSFDGISIANKRVNGPYQVKFATVKSIHFKDEWGEYKLEPYTTQFYDWQKFGD